MKQNEISPIQENNSFVDEFLKTAKDVDGNYQELYIRDYFYEDLELFRSFCKELEILREMSKTVNNYMQYLKTKE